jgi:phage protein D
MAEAPLSQLAVYVARPTVMIDTQSYPKVSELLISMEMMEQEGGMCSLELRVSNVASEPGGGADFAFEDDAILRLGAAISVHAGDEAAPREIFQGTITGLEVEFVADGPPELVVLAEDVFQQARMARRTKVHENITLADLASSIANDLGLTPVVTALTENIGTQVQLNESDLAFLQRLLVRYNADLQVVGTEMHVSPLGDVRRGEVELVLHSQLQEAKVLADLAHQVTEVTVAGWDPLRGERVTGTSTGAQLGPGSGRDGKTVLQDAIGERAEHIGDPVVTTSAEAQALADAAFDAHARRFLLLEGTAEGNPALRVGTHVKVSGLGPRFDNTYYVTQATHLYDVMQGYKTSFEATCAYWGGG